MAHATRKLKLTKFAVQNVNFQYLSVYRLRIEASEAVAMDSRIFVYRRDGVNPYTNDVTDTFFTVASPVDMSEYPPEEPDPQKAFPFFRKNFVELDFRSVALAEEAWLLIVQEANVLVHALNRMEQLVPIEEVQIGPFPGDGPSDTSQSISV